LKESNSYTEEQLVALVKQQSEEGFTYLYEKYAKALYTVIIQIVRDHEVANDVLQKSFVNIWRNAASYDSSKGRLFTWMLNISKNASIDYSRSREFKNARQNQPLENSVNLADNQHSVEQNIDSIGLRKYVAMLKDDYKQIVMQSYFMGFTHEEIAQNLNIPLGTVKTRLRAAIIKLRELMN
jgi:RNA polymerase sigma factor (sigma-70 family)